MPLNRRHAQWVIVARMLNVPTFIMFTGHHDSVKRQSIKLCQQHTKRRHHETQIIPGSGY